MNTKADIAILFAWIGNADRAAAGISQSKRPPQNNESQASSNESYGPILRTILQGETSYQKLVLLGDKPEDDGFIGWLKTEVDRSGIKAPEISLVRYEGSAMDRLATYSASKKAIEDNAIDTDTHRYQRSYLLSGGTPAMHTNLILLAYTQTYKGRMIDTSVKEGVQVVEPWVEIIHFEPQPPLNAEGYLSLLYEEASTNSETAKNMIGVQDAISWATLAAKAPLNDYPVLIQGPTGAGKEIIAKIISELTQKFYQFKEANFQPLNCAAIPSELLESELFGHVKGAFTGAIKEKKGLIESASNGTLFLDEIGDMPLILQAKLLRVLNDKTLCPVGSNEIKHIENLRIISATHRDLQAMVDAGTFREDLYFRLNTIPITLPSLKNRREDIPALAVYFINKINEDFKQRPEDNSLKAVYLGNDYLEAFKEYDWPGNIRELESILKFGAILVNRTQDRIISGNVLRRILSQRKSSPLRDAYILDIVKDDKPVKDMLDEIEYLCYQKLLDDLNNKNRAWLAIKMGCSDNTLRNKEKKWVDEEKVVDPCRYKKSSTE